MSRPKSFSCIWLIALAQALATAVGFPIPPTFRSLVLTPRVPLTPLSQSHLLFDTPTLPLTFSHPLTPILARAQWLFAMDEDITAVDSPRVFPSSTLTCPLTAPEGVLSQEINWPDLTSAVNPESVPCPQPPYHDNWRLPEFSACMEPDVNSRLSSNPYSYVKEEEGTEIFDEGEITAFPFNLQNLPPAPPREALAAAIRVRRLTEEERREKVERYLMKKSRRNFRKRIKYACRKTLADIRPRVRGRFAKNQTKLEDFEMCRSTVTQDSEENRIKEEPCVSVCSLPNIHRKNDVRYSRHAYVAQY